MGNLFAADAEKGFYIFTEASKKRNGQKARFRIDLVEGSDQVLCIAFRYVMYGFHTQSVSLKIKDGSSERVLWSKKGKNVKM